MHVDFNYKDEFRNLSFKDKRLNNRFIKIMGDCSSDYGSSFLKVSKNRHQAKAAYRLFANEHFCPDQVLKAHKESSVKRIIDSKSKLILAIQDTTSLNYNSRKKTEGLGLVGGRESLGIYLHTTLAFLKKELLLVCLIRSIG